jgi:hypothetical protein
MALKVALIKLLLFKWYTLPSFCLCLCARVCFVCPKYWIIIIIIIIIIIKIA